MQLYKLAKFIEEEDSTNCIKCNNNTKRYMYQYKGENLSNKYHSHISLHLHIPVSPEKIHHKNLA